MNPSSQGPTWLHIILDVFSRYVVGWMVAPRETAEWAKCLIADTCEKQNIPPGQLTLHADRGVQAGGLPAGGSGRHQIAQPPLCFG
jgi:transposase InsO family protein